MSIVILTRYGTLKSGVVALIIAAQLGSAACAELTETATPSMVAAIEAA
jgi:hypothetical protein